MVIITIHARGEFFDNMAGRVPGLDQQLKAMATELLQPTPIGEVVVMSVLSSVTGADVVVGIDLPFITNRVLDMQERSDDFSAAIVAATTTCSKCVTKVRFGGADYVGCAQRAKGAD